MAEPNLLREARPGEFFVPHLAELQECVCARVHYDGPGARADEQDTEVVVIACRVGEGEIGHQPAGHSAIVPLDGWITFVEPVERMAFRERMAFCERRHDWIPPAAKGRIERARHLEEPRPDRL
jgi:hypothetical protein